MQGRVGVGCGGGGGSAASEAPAEAPTAGAGAGGQQPRRFLPPFMGGNAGPEDLLIMWYHSML